MASYTLWGIRTMEYRLAMAERYEPQSSPHIDMLTIRISLAEALSMSFPCPNMPRVDVKGCSPG